jgi:crotonyl-CoA reductase
MSSPTKAIAEAAEARASADAVLGLELPKTMRAVTTHRDEEKLFEGLPSAEKDPTKSLHLDEVPVPALGPNEALVAVMASAINFNTVWTSIFEPISTFVFLDRNAKRSELWKRHALPYHIVGSDASGIVLRVGPGVTKWKPGDRVVVHCSDVEMQEPEGYADAMLDPNQMIWGFETNFGGMAELALVKANQLMPKPEHLTWEEAACNGLVNSTAYRQLVSRNGAGMKQGDVVLVWGASGGLGGYATQYALNGGAYPVGVVSSAKRAELVRRLGCERVIDRRAEGYRFWDGDKMNMKEMRRFGAKVRELSGGEDPDIVYEHPGRETFAASVFVARRGGTIVTCASTSGYEHVYDNRYLWMNLKRIVGSHFANYREAWEANRLVCKGAIHPTLSRVFPLEGAGEAALSVHRNEHEGKVGVLCLAPREGLGVVDGALRERHLAQIQRYRHA